MLCLALLSWSNVSTAKERIFPERCGCGIDTPDSWTLAQPDPNQPRKVKLTFDRGASFIISSHKRKIPLDKVVSKTLEIAAERGWKVVKQTKERVASNDAVRVLFEVATRTEGLVTRQVIYFMNTDRGYRTLHFTAPLADFKPDQWASVAQTYRTL